MLAIALWSAGLVTAPRQEAIASLLGTTAAAGLGAAMAAAAARGAAAWARRLAALAGALALVGSTAFLIGVLRLPRGPVAIIRRVAAPPVAAERLRLIDFNVLHGYPGFPGQEERFARQVAALRALAPDVLVVQEAWSAARHGSFAVRLGEALAMDTAYARANGSRRLLGFEEGSAVLSRFPISRAERLVLAPRERPWRARIALLAALDLGGGELLTVVGFHLANLDPSVADAQALHLAERLGAVGPASGAVADARDGHERREAGLAENLLVVAGDFNRASGTPALAAFTARGFADLLPGGIDHVLWRAPSSSRWYVGDARWTLRPEDLAHLIGERAEISDHPAILVELVRP